MLSIRKINPLARAIGIIGAVMALVTGVTYAALQSQATLTDNTISSATADLQIDNMENNGTNPQAFSDTDTGFAFTGVVPGGSASNSHSFQLKNNGTTPMTIKVGMPALPTWVVSPSGTVDNSKVMLNITCTGPTLTYNDFVQTIWSTGSSMSGTLGAGEVTACTTNVTMDSDAFTGESAASSTFNLIFTGTAS